MKQNRHIDSKYNYIIEYVAKYPPTLSYLTTGLVNNPYPFAFKHNSEAGLSRYANRYSSRVKVTEKDP